MPNLEDHCARSMKRYGVEGRDIHSWLDSPSRNYAGSHRQFRHDTETVKLVGELFGKTYGKELAENIALDHIMNDHQAEIRNRNSEVSANLSEKKMDQPSLCRRCYTELKSSDQNCPYCGALKGSNPEPAVVKRTPRKMSGGEALSFFISWPFLGAGIYSIIQIWLTSYFNWYWVALLCFIAFWSLFFHSIGGLPKGRYMR